MTLARWTGTDDILVGAPVANRARQATNETMGYFAGIVPLRRVDPGQTFSAGLRRTHQAAVDCFSNAMPFAELARALGDAGAPGHNPIFEIRFALQNHPIPDVALPGLSAKLRMRSTGTARYHLACEVTEEGEQLEVVWLFRTQLCPQAEVENLGRMFQNVLAGACERAGYPDCRPQPLKNAMNPNLTAENVVDPQESHEPEPHEPHWLIRSAFPVLTGLFFLTQISMALAVYHGNYWIAVPLVIVSSHLMHGMLIGFHEASHGLLRHNRVLNEIDGVIIGVFSLMSFSLYRAAHQLHHAYLATERDEELWPFVHPRMPRWVRVGAALLELTLGIFFTPWLFFRTFLRAGSPIRNKKLRRRIWLEFAGTIVIWAVILTVIAFTHTWKYFLWLHVIPAWLAGNMQSVRKYVEHVGLTGSTSNSSTRSVVAEGWMAHFVNFTLLHEPYHAIHHWRSGLPHPELPRHAAVLEPAVPEERPPFRTFGAALYDTLINLGDPRVGAQWRGVTAPTRQELAKQGLN